MTSILLVVLAIGQAEPPANADEHRKYAAGPLEVREFKGKAKVRDSSRFRAQAYTHTDVRYDMKFRVQSTRSHYIARLESIAIFAAFYPNLSWTRGKIDSALLDHEQGHFDITEIHALRVQTIFQDLERRKKSPQAVSKNQDEAIQMLGAAIDKIMADNRAQWVDAQEDYDRQTKHSTNQRKQAEMRRVQLETLKELRSKVKRKKDRPAKRKSGKSKSRRTDPSLRLGS